MKKRRGRRSLMWWSWLLVLVTLAGVVGGFQYGKTRWEEAPKDYLGVARVSFNVRPPFVFNKAGGQDSTQTIANPNEREVMSRIESEEVLSKVVEELALAEKWETGTTVAVNRIRIGLQLDLNRETGELEVKVTLNDPKEAAEVANALAALIPATIASFDESQKAEAFKLLEIEARPLEDLESEAESKLKRALEKNGITLKLTPEIDLGPYQELNEVLSAKVEWDTAREDLRELRAEQNEYRQYWLRRLRPSMVTVRAEAPPSFVGPPVEPFQMRWLTYGLTAGLIVGSLLMLACWKIFP